MTTLETPNFSNSCGKIFADEIVLATTYKESVVAVKDIKRVSFTSRPLPTSLFFVALPALLFVFPFFSKQDTFLNVIFIGLGIVLMGVSLYNINKKHTLSFKLVSGESISVNVSPRNIKEAKKFTGMVNAKIARR